MSEEELKLLQKLKNNDEGAYLKLYKIYKPSFISWIRERFNINEDEAVEIFQSTILSFFENIRRSKIDDLKSSLKTYIYAIGKNKAYESLRNQKRYQSLDLVIDEEEDMEHIATIDFDSSTVNENRLETMKESLKELGSPCDQIITLFYFNRLSLEDIKSKFGYKSEGSIKSQKFKCMERLRKIYFRNYKSLVA